MTWCPPPELGTSEVGAAANDPMELQVVTPNVDGDTLFFRGRVYNFIKNVRQLTPLERLVASVPRGSSLT